MGATNAPHALIVRANGLAPAGVMGIWLLAVMLVTGPAGADEPDATPVTSPPRPASVARKTYGPYIFCQPGGRPTQPPASEPGKVALVEPPVRPSYLYFAPGKRSAAPALIGPVAKPIVPDVPPPTVARPHATKEELAAEFPPPRVAKHQSLIFFTPTPTPRPNAQLGRGRVASRSHAPLILWASSPHRVVNSGRFQASDAATR